MPVSDWDIILPHLVKSIVRGKLKSLNFIEEGVSIDLSILNLVL